MNAPRYENKITLGNVAQIVGLALLIWGAGSAWADSNSKHDKADLRITAIETFNRQAQADRELLIELRTDMRYLISAVDELLGKLFVLYSFSAQSICSLERNRS